MHFKIIFMVLILLATGSTNDENRTTDRQRHYRRKGAYSNPASNPRNLKREESSSGEGEEKHTNRAQSPQPAQAHAPIRSGGGIPLTQFSYGYAITDHDHEYGRNQNQNARFHGSSYSYSPYDQHQQQQYGYDSGTIVNSEPQVGRHSESRHRMPENHMTRTSVPVARIVSPVPYRLGYSPVVPPFRSLPHLAPPITYLTQPGAASSGESGQESRLF